MAKDENKPVSGRELDDVDVIVGETPPQFVDFTQERTYWVNKRQRIQQMLGDRFGRAAYTKAQQRVRQRSSDSFQKWIIVRTKMDQRRATLKAHLIEIDQRLDVIRDQVAKESMDRNRAMQSERSNFPPWANLILEEIAGLRAELETLKSLLQQQSDKQS